MDTIPLKFLVATSDPALDPPDPFRIEIGQYRRGYCVRHFGTPLARHHYQRDHLNMVLTFTQRGTAERGFLQNDWLKAHFTFSCPGFYESEEHKGFGALEVMMEASVEPGKGFEKHGHENVEVFSYVISGALAHHDSIGNVDTLKRGSVQVNTAGTGMTHSEDCQSKEPVHFMQFWATPFKKGLTPKYYIRHFTDEERSNQWACVIAPPGVEDATGTRGGSGPAPIQSSVIMYSTLLSPSKSVSYAFPYPLDRKEPQERKAYLHVCMAPRDGVGSGARIEVADVAGSSLSLAHGDGLYINGYDGDKMTIKNDGDIMAEVLLFDLVEK